MTSLQTEAHEHHAYREAGCAVMSCLIRKGYTERFVPIDRSLILVPFQYITVNETNAYWSKLTGSLGSLITTAQVLSAGYLAERIHYQTADEEFPSKDASIQTALHLIRSYIGEYGGDDMTATQRNSSALQLFRQLFDYVDAELHTLWTVVDQVARLLLETEVLSEAQVFTILEANITESKKYNEVTVVTKHPVSLLDAFTSFLRRKGWRFWR